MTTKEERAEAAADARAEAKADAKADAAEARAADRAEAKEVAMETDGYVVMEGGQVKLVEQGHVAVEIMSDFIGHNREHLARGERVSLPRSLALAQIAIGNARELTAEEIEAAGSAPTPPETVEVRDPKPTTRDPKVHKR